MAMPKEALPAAVEQPQVQVAEYVPAVSVTIEQARDNFQRLQQVTRELMQPGVDFDTIPGTPKPSLLKPGAEHLLQFFGLSHRVERIHAIEDWEQGFFYYCYKASIFKARPLPTGGVYEHLVAECEGSANSKEKRYRNQDVYTIVNTLQKMAIKRALVGATLQATGTSGMFTQDVEDMDVQDSSSKRGGQARPGNGTRQAQQRQEPARQQQAAPQPSPSISPEQVWSDYYAVAHDKSFESQAEADLFLDRSWANSARNPDKGHLPEVSGDVPLWFIQAVTNKLRPMSPAQVSEVRDKLAQQYPLPDVNAASMAAGDEDGNIPF